MVEKAGEQHTAQIKLEEFPTKYRAGILQILHAFLENKKKQSTLLPDVRSLSDLENTKMDIEKFGFSIQTAEIKMTDGFFEEMLKRPQYIYSKPKNISTSFVVDKVSISEIVEHQNNPVKVNGEVLYDHIDVIRLLGAKKLYKLGSDITITIEKNSFNINYSFNGSLHEQICEMKLILALMRKQPIIIGKNLFPSDFLLDFHNHSVEDATEKLSGLIHIDSALKKLLIKKDLNLGDLSDEGLRKLNHLVNGILEDQSVPFSINGKAAIGKLTIGNITVLLATKDNSEGSGFLVYDFFALNDLILTRNARNGVSPEESIRISPYLMITADIINEIDNLDFSEIVPSIEKFPYSALSGEKTILLILELLKYYDEAHNLSVLDIVVELIEFLEINDKSQDELYKINRLQTEKRRRKLTKEEIQYLVSLKQSGIPLQYQLAANILLESFREAEIIYELLPDIERQSFDTFPIKNLWKKSE